MSASYSHAGSARASNQDNRYNYPRSSAPFDNGPGVQAAPGHHDSPSASSRHRHEQHRSDRSHSLGTFDFPDFEAILYYLRRAHQKLGANLSKAARWVSEDVVDDLLEAKRRLEDEIEQLRAMHAHQLADERNARRQLEVQLEGQRGAHQREIANRDELFRLDQDRQQERSRLIEEELKQAQIATFAGTARTGYPPDEDRVIIQDVDLLHNNVWAWAKRHCLAVADNLHGILSADRNGTLTACLDEAGIDPKLLGNKNALRIKPLPALVLGAIVIRDIYTKLFNNPFFFYDSEVFTTNGEKGAALGHTLAMLYKRNMDDGVQWRTLLLRNLYPWVSARTRDEAAMEAVKVATASMTEASKSMAQAFLRGPGRPLLAASAADVQGEGARELQQCYQQAGELFTRLHTQELKLSWQQSNLQTTTYDAHSMRPHALHRIYQDDQEPVRNRIVDIVVSPAVSREWVRDTTTHNLILVKAEVGLDLKKLWWMPGAHS